MYIVNQKEKAYTILRVDINRRMRKECNNNSMLMTMDGVDAAAAADGVD